MKHPELFTHDAPQTCGLMSTSEIAEYYGVVVSTFLQWFHAGIVPAAVAVGKTYRWDREEVAKAIAKHTAKVNRTKRLRAERTVPNLLLGATLAQQPPPTDEQP